MHTIVNGVVFLLETKLACGNRDELNMGDFKNIVIAFLPGLASSWAMKNTLFWVIKNTLFWVIKNNLFWVIKNTLF